MTGILDQLIDRIQGREASVAPRLAPSFGPEPAVAVLPPEPTPGPFRAAPAEIGPEEIGPRPERTEPQPAIDRAAPWTAPQWVAPTAPLPNPTPTRIDFAPPVPADTAAQRAGHPDPEPPRSAKKIGPEPAAPVPDRPPPQPRIIETRRAPELRLAVPFAVDRPRTDPAPAPSPPMPDPVALPPPAAARLAPVIGRESDVAPPADPAPDSKARFGEPRAPMPPAPPLMAREPNQPPIRIEIGIVEILAVRAPAAATPGRRSAPSRTGPEMSLDSYLAGRTGRT